MKNTKPKVRLWSVLTGLTAILTVAAIVGNIIANQYATTINVALNASTYKIIHGENTGDTEYFKKGFASDEEREAYEAELCATVEAEGAALLKNENNALPLASGAKVSLFGHGSVDLMYGGTGSGSVDTSKAPNLKQALEAQGITINQTLWDLYSSDSMMSKYSRLTPASISDTLEANTQYAVNEAPWSTLSSAESSFAEYGDAAIVVLSRSGGEGADLPSGENGTNDSWISGQEGDGNYLALSAEEIELSLVPLAPLGRSAPSPPERERTTMAASPYSAKLLSALDRALQGASLTAYWVLASSVSEMEAGVMRLYLLIMLSDLYRSHRVWLMVMP